MGPTETVINQDLVGLVEAARRGSRRAREDLAADLRPGLERFAASRGAADPGGVANTVLAEFIVRLDRFSFEVPAQIWAYLLRACRSRIIDERRGSAPFDVLSIDAGDDESGLEPAEEGFERLVVDGLLVDDLLADLTDEQSGILRLRFLEGMTLEQAANQTGRSLTATKALQRRALRAAGKAALMAGLIAIAFALIAIPIAQYSDRSVQPATTDTVFEAEQSSTTTTSQTGASTTSASTSTTSTESNESNTSATSERRPSSATTPATTSGSGSSTTRPADVGTTAGTGSSVPATTISSDDPVDTKIYSCMGVSGTVEELEALGYQVTIGSDDDDTINVRFDGGPHFILGRRGDDVITTGSEDDIVCGGNGDDTIYLNGGNDAASGENGNDTIYGAEGADILRGSNGRDSLWGGRGNDSLYGEDGQDTLTGGADDDRLIGGDNADIIDGEGGMNSIDGGLGADTITVGEFDTLTRRDDEDVILDRS